MSQYLILNALVHPLWASKVVDRAAEISGRNRFRRYVSPMVSSAVISIRGHLHIFGQHALIDRPDDMQCVLILVLSYVICLYHMLVSRVASLRKHH